ncbi:MAG: diguanylate cyclase [Planctomycetaceae bacterium]|nr:diguanylate cyclase [Planctomycetaceae bacterium]
MSFGLLLFLMTILIINIATGYVLATILGIGPPGFRVAFRHIRQVIQEKIHRYPLRLQFAGIMAMPKNWLARFRTEHPVSLKKEKEAVETTEEKIQKISSVEVEKMLDDNAEAITKVSPISEMYDDNLTNQVFKRNAEDWQVPDKGIETSLFKLNVLMMQSGQFASELDRQLRKTRESATREMADKFCQEIIADCTNYLEGQSQITREMHERAEEFGELKTLAGEIDRTILEQTSQIETTLGNVEQFSKIDSPKEIMERLMAEIANLRRARHRTRDLQDRAFMAIIRQEDRMESINRHQMFIDQTTGLNNRIAFETNLWDWWRQSRQEKSKLTFALYDIAGFNDLNNRIGVYACDQLIKGVTALVGEKTEGKDFVGLYAGNCIVGVSSNCGMRKTVAFVERIRQELEQRTFLYDQGREETSLTVTCAVAEAMPQQSEDELIANLDMTLAAAKKSGRNVTYQWNTAGISPKPEPVNPPQLSIKKSVFDLDAMKVIEQE